MKDRIPYLCALALTVLVAFTVLLGVAQLAPVAELYQYGFLTNIAGYLALVLVAAGGVLMLSRRPLLGQLEDPELLMEVHAGVAGAGGAFLVFRVVFFLVFPLRLPSSSDTSRPTSLLRSGLRTYSSSRV